MNPKIKNSQLNTILSWLNHICFSEIKSKYNDSDSIEKIIYNIERYYSKMKPLQIAQTDLNKVTDKLKEVQKVLEDEVTFKDENGDMVYLNDDIKCINYSPQLLALTSLDYLLNVEKDTSLRVKFGYLNLNKLFEEVEKRDKELYYSTMKIYSKMIKVIL